MVTDPQFPLSSCLQPVFRYLAFPFLPLSQSLTDLQLCVCPWQTCRRQRRAHYLSRAGCKRRGESSQLHHLDHSLGPRGCVIVDTLHTPPAGSRPHGDVGPLCQAYLKIFFLSLSSGGPIVMLYRKRHNYTAWQLPRPPAPPGILPAGSRPHGDVGPLC